MSAAEKFLAVLLVEKTMPRLATLLSNDCQRKVVAGIEAFAQTAFITYVDGIAELLWGDVILWELMDSTEAINRFANMKVDTMAAYDPMMLHNS